VSRKHEIARRELVLVKSRCCVCQDEFFQRMRLPHGETLQTYVHTDGCCVDRCEAILRLWMTCRTTLSLRRFYASIVMGIWWGNRYGFASC